MAHQIFEGLKVADFSWVIVGPTMARYLADHGATVIRIESHSSLDVLRHSPPFKDGKVGVNRSSNYANYNANKYGITLNLSHAGARKIARKICGWADVVVESFTPGTVEEWGLGYEDLKRENPSLIMISTCNQGRTGPHASHPGYGFQLVSLSGFAELTGWPDRMPSQPFGAYTDFIAYKAGVAALVAALINRKRTGKGQHLDLSQFEASLHFLSPVLLDYDINGREATRQGNRCPYAAPHGVFPCKGEDRWIAIAVFNDAEWESLCQVMGKPRWALAQRFRYLISRKRNEEELERNISNWTKGYNAGELMLILQQAGVAAGLVSDARDVHEDPQLEYRKHFVPFEHAEIGLHHVDSVAFTLSKTPSSYRMPAPCLGEHNDYIYREVLKIPEEEYVELLLAGAFE